MKARHIMAALLAVGAGLFLNCSTAPAAISFVQSNSKQSSSVNTLSAAYINAQTAGNMNVVVIGWPDTTSTVSSVADTRGNIYTSAIGPTRGTGVSQSIYYAKNIVSAGAGGNTVTAQLSASVPFLQMRALEYSGLSIGGPLDVAHGGSGSGVNADSGSATATASNELVVGGGTTVRHYTGPGANFTQRQITAYGDIDEERTVTATGSYNATASSANPAWVMQMASFSATAMVSGVSNYYVNSSGGSDSNTGSQASPWKTIQHAIGNFVLGTNGTVIHVAAGLYTNFTISSGGSGLNTRLAVQCDDYSKSTKTWNCLISNVPAGTASIGVTTADYVDIVGFNVQPSSDSGAAISVQFRSGHGNSVHIIDNYVHDFGQTASPINTNFPIGCPSSGAIGTKSEHNTNLLTDSQVIGNWITNYGKQGINCNQTHGIYANTSNQRIENNVLISAYDIQVYDQPCGSIIANNTIVNSGWVGIQVAGNSCSPAGLNTVINNIIVNPANNGVFMGAGSSSPCDSTHHNHIYNNSINGYGTTEFYGAKAACDDEVGNYTSEGPASTFVNYSTADYHLKSTSLAKDGGATSCATGTNCTPGWDFEGASRPQGSAIDVGAYEYH